MANGHSLLILESTWDEKGHYLGPEISVRPFGACRFVAAPEVLASLPRNGLSRSHP